MFDVRSIENFEVKPVMAWAAARPDIPLLAGAAYLALVLAGPAAMRGRAALSLRTPLLVWNAALCAFSALGASAMLARAAAVAAAPGGVRASLCGALVYDGTAAGFWLTLFMLSKLPELLDTVFLVLRKREVSFLHAFHHLSVMLYCWFAFARQSHLGFYFTTLNYVVHAIMYLYYAMASAGAPPPWGSYVTLLQIGQMVASCALCAYSLAVGCEDAWSLRAGVALYAAYLALFVRFFAARKARGAKSE